MPDDRTWKWWVPVLVLPIVALLVAVGGLYFQYLTYQRDTEAQVKKMREEVATEFQDKLAQRDSVIEKQSQEIADLHKRPDEKPRPPEEFPVFDYSKYVSDHPLAEPKSGTKQIDDFVDQNWPTLAWLGALVLIGALVNAATKRK